jgi:hypothetical protein
MAGSWDESGAGRWPPGGQNPNLTPSNMATTLEITSTYYQSPLGLLRIGGSDTYISEISFIDHLSDEEYQSA